MLRSDSIIVISELPLDQQEPFSKWVEPKTCPYDDEDITKKYAYRWDYEHWFNYWSKGKIAPRYD